MATALACGGTDALEVSIRPQNTETAQRPWQIVVPRVAYVRWIQPFNSVTAAAQVLSTPPFSTAYAEMTETEQLLYTANLIAMLEGLSGTANGAIPRDPADPLFNDGQTRGFSAIDSFSFRCCPDGTIDVASVVPPTGRSSNGDTPLPYVGEWTNLGSGDFFLPTEGGNGSFRYSISGGTMRVTKLTRARIDSWLAAAPLWFIGFAAPWIWSEITVTASCDGSGSVNVSASAFPSGVLYVDGRNIDFRLQRDLGSFLASGGTTQNPGSDAPGGQNVSSDLAASIRKIDLPEVCDCP